MTDNIQSIEINGYLYMLTNIKTSKYKMFLKYLYCNIFSYIQPCNYFLKISD